MGTFLRSRDCGQCHTQQAAFVGWRRVIAGGTVADAGFFGRDSGSQSGQFAFAFVTCCLWWLPTAILGHCHGKWSEGYEGPFAFCGGERES